MTKKDFELIAKVIDFQILVEGSEVLYEEFDKGWEGCRREIADEFVRVLSRTNSRFDRDRFLKACGVQP